MILLVLRFAWFSHGSLVLCWRAAVWRISAIAIILGVVFSIAPVRAHALEKYDRPMPGAGENIKNEESQSGVGADHAGQNQPEKTAVSDSLSIPDWLWLSGQANFIAQVHPAFHAMYSGEHSLRPEGENARSRVLTLYTGLRLTRTTEVLFDIEEAGGTGLSQAFGLGGFTNLDVVRNPALTTDPYVARIMIHQIIPFSDTRVPAVRNPLSLATSLPERRLELRVGKFSTVDFFDVNAIGSDSQHQFMNWAVVNNGAYDYAADTRGYTFGALIEYYDRNWVLRFGEMLMPRIANGIQLDWDPTRSRAENLELEYHHNALLDREGVIRILYYVNHANMGSYSEALQAFQRGQDPTPDVTAHRHQGTVKYGFGLNLEQELTEGLRAFGRGGWNEGHHETFAYTEIDRSVAVGADLKGDRWGREQDQIGVAYVINGLAKDHRRYLAAGGLGFILGDGALHYGTERIVEGYYRLHLWRGIAVSPDFQWITNPGYNRDRGPVYVFGLRLHLEEVLGRTF